MSRSSLVARQLFTRGLASSLLGAMLVLLGTQVPAQAAEKDAARSLGELYDVALLMDSAVLDLNMLLGENQSPIYKGRLDDTLKKLDAAQKASAGSLAGSGANAQTIAAISDDVAAFIKLARENRDTTMRTGAPENAVVDEMMLHRKEARAGIDPLYADLEKRAGLAGSPLSEARSLALLLQQMAATYVENASAAYVSNRSQDSTDVTIDQMAKSFSKRLSAMLVKAKGDDALKRVRSIQSKWKFIEKSMLNYQEKTVPFLVDRYAQAIVGDLVALAALLEGQGG